MQVRFTNVAKDFAKDPIEWCGHDHESFESAHDCPWKPEAIPYAEGKAYLPDIYIEKDWDPDLHTQCTHLCHPLECDRCIEYRSLVTPCIHSYDPLTCGRCFVHDAWGLEVGFTALSDEEIENNLRVENELLSKLSLRQVRGEVSEDGEDGAGGEGNSDTQEGEHRELQADEDSAHERVSSAMCDDMDACESSGESEGSEPDYLPDSGSDGSDDGSGEQAES